MADYITGGGYLLGLDLTGGSSYVDVKVVSSDESLNETVDTWYNLSDGGYPTNEVVALDPEHSFVFKFDADDAQLVSLLDMRYAKGSDRHVGYQLSDNAVAKTITGDGTITSISAPRTIANVIEVSVSMKFRGAPTLAAIV